jgi:hypothetical protein
MLTDPDRSGARRWLRAAMLPCIAAAGLVAIVGSGGGFPEFVCCDPPSPWVNVTPPRATVQVGTSVEFTAVAFAAHAPVSYQWRRNGVAIARATAATYTLPGANLSDDGAEFSVAMTAANGADTASALLRVSSAAPVRFEDAEFAVADWALTAVVDPPTGGPTHFETRAPSGGNPGSMRIIEYQVPAGRSSIRVFHTALSATYDPAVRGAPYVIDVALDCNRLNTSTSGETLAIPAFEQDGRWYGASLADLCAPTWFTIAATSLLAADFRLLAGPACAAGQSCPDFSASAVPMRLGFVSGLNLSPDSAAGAVSQGIDNWKMTVWRR